MSQITQPYPRIFIPMVNSSVIDPCPYLDDNGYCYISEAMSLINGARIIIQDFIKLSEYIEPIDVNKDVFSHRTYELLLRVATEFEANCKGILKANGYNPNRNLKIQDYYKINSIMKLDEYEISTHLWYPDKTLKPLLEWANGHTLTWYQAYNHSKHNRFTNFKEASLENVFAGICSLVVVLAAQFPNRIGLLDGSNIRMSSDDDDNTLFVGNFTITFPYRGICERCNFDWDTLKTSNTPFQSYKF